VALNHFCGKWTFAAVVKPGIQLELDATKSRRLAYLSAATTGPRPISAAKL
jgi:hypothetical protein